MKAVIFDYKGVLTNERRLHEDAYMAVARQRGVQIGREDIKKIYHLSPREKVEAIFGEKDTAKVLELLMEKKSLYLQLAKEEGLLPSVPKVVDRLSKKYRLALIANSPRRQFISLFPPEVREKFKVVLTAEDIEKPKPHPQSLAEALKLLVVTKKEACYVGDSVSDIKAALRLGMIAIGITTGTASKKELQEAGADLVVESLEDLEKTLDPGK